MCWCCWCRVARAACGAACGEARGCVSSRTRKQARAPATLSRWRLALAAPSPSRRGPPVSQPQRFLADILLHGNCWTMWRRNNKPIYLTMSIFVPIILYELRGESLRSLARMPPNRFKSNVNNRRLIQTIFEQLQRRFKTAFVGSLILLYKYLRTKEVGRF